MRLSARVAEKCREVRGEYVLLTGLTALIARRAQAKYFVNGDLLPVEYRRDERDNGGPMHRFDSEDPD